MDLGVFLGVIGILITIILWLVSKEDIIGFFKRASIDKHLEKLQLRTEFKIAIIDDELESYPVQYIRDLGFTVKEFREVSFTDSNELKKFDLILLDVKGVVKEDLAEGGAKLLKMIKQKRPLLPIIAVSSGYFQTELNDYFKISDATLNKPIEEFRITEMLHELKKEFFNEKDISQNIENLIKQLEVSNSKKNKLRKSVVKYLEQKIDLFKFSDVVHEIAKSKAEEIIFNSKKLFERILNA